jgi:tRNA modification GTPase
VEAAIDFPEEEIDFLADARIGNDLEALIDQVDELLRRAHTGQLLRDGMTLVIAGRPNAGKSSLLNALTGQDSAIVTEVPGTTRDLLREEIDIDGLPVHVIDTAGIRASDDVVEQEGVRRAREQIASADHALWVYDGALAPIDADLAHAELPQGLAVTRIHNKADLSGHAIGLESDPAGTVIYLSAKTGAGIDDLRAHLKQLVAYEGSGEGDFSARRRHLDAIGRARASLLDGRRALDAGRAGELLAEDLRQAQLSLSTVTGDFSADDLLGEIFSSFCIGK